MEIGIYSFGDIAIDSKQAPGASGAKRMQELLEEIRLADEVGLDVFALGEHHRKDYMVSAPAVVLGAAASVTKNIRLSSAVTVLSSDDPVRVFQQYATVDLISNGRAEIMAGRGSFIESFPLFGYDLDDYDTLFSEKLDLLLRVNQDEIVRWSGKHRAPLPGLGVYPRPVQEKLPIWIAVGGTPASVVRAGKLGLPLAIAIIGGIPARFGSLTELYRKSYAESAQPIDRLQLGINAHVFVGDNSQDAADAYFPSYAAMMTQIGRERGWPPVTRAQYESMRNPKASLMVGSVAEVTEKMLYWHELFGHTRFLAQMTVGPTPHRELMRSIELFGSKVAPEVRKHVRSVSST